MTRVVQEATVSLGLKFGGVWKEGGWDLSVAGGHMGGMSCRCKVHRGANHQQDAILTFALPGRSLR